MKKKNFTKAFTIAMVSASLLAVGPASAVLAKNVGVVLVLDYPSHLAIQYPRANL